MNLIDFLAAKLKEHTNTFLITQDNNTYKETINEQKIYFKETKIYLPNIDISVCIAENNNDLSRELLDNFFTTLTYLISKSYVYYYARPICIYYYNCPILRVHKDHLFWGEQIILKTDNIQYDLNKFCSNIIKQYLTSDELILTFNNNHFITYEEIIDLTKQLIKYINTINHVYKIYPLHDAYQIHDINNMILRIVSNRINIIDKILEIYNKAYKPYILPSTELEMSIGDKYIKLYVTNMEGLDDVLEYIDVDDLDKQSGAMKRYFNILYKFNKLIIDNFGHIINKDLFIDIDIWLTDNIASIYEDNDVDYWFNKMVVDLTL